MNKLRTEVTFVEKNKRTFSKRVEFYENGQIAKTGLYANSPGGWLWAIPAGPVISYYEDGTLKSEILHDEFGNLEGESRYFDEKGKLKRTKSYQQDKLIEEVDLEVSSENR